MGPVGNLWEARPTSPLGPEGKFGPGPQTQKKTPVMPVSSGTNATLALLYESVSSEMVLYPVENVETVTDGVALLITQPGL